MHNKKGSAPVKESDLTVMLKLYLAPMEELTGYVFRNAINSHFGYIDKYFTPFISPDNRIMKTRNSRELLPSSNEGIKVVPQLLTNDPEQFNEAAHLIAGFGYDEININFGCPSNTVTSKFKGSGILRAPDLMERFLDGVFNGADSVIKEHPKIRISVKTRVGYNDTSDFEKVAKILNCYPFSEVTVHPRLKKDLYKGKPRMEMFDMACDLLDANIVYNGDVYSPEDFEELEKRSDAVNSCGKQKVTAVMIGRGAIKNPGIFRQIRTKKAMTADELYDFLSDLYDTYRTDLTEENAVGKLKEVWSYTVGLIDDEKERSKIFKTIIKSKGGNEYRNAVLVAKGAISTASIFNPRH